MGIGRELKLTKGTRGDCRTCEYAPIRFETDSLCNRICGKKNDCETPAPMVTLRGIWNSKRKCDITEATMKYLMVGKQIPIEWIEEYNELSKED